MKKYVMILFFVCVLVVPTTVFANADTTIPFAGEPIQLYGPKGGTEFRYSIDGEVETGSLHLVTSHSSLLIAPSSLTVAIDNIVVRTIDLTLTVGNLEELVIPLTKENLKKGDHVVTLNFDGTIKEGVCVDQHTSGNWLTVHLQSYLKLEGYSRHYSTSLATFVEDFTVLEGERTSIIIPEKADYKTQAAAIRLQAQLLQSSWKDAEIEITAKPTTRDKWIVLGELDQFENEEVKALLSKTDIEETGMTIGKIDSSTAYIVAHDSREIERLLHILFRAEWSKQLAGNHLHISSLPEEGLEVVRTFEQLNIAPITIESSAPMTSTYYVPLPYALPLKGSTLFHLELQKSSLLENYIEDHRENSAELILNVNGKMHAISIGDLVNEKTHYSIDIPVANELFMQDSTFTFQIIGNGFQFLDPCMSTDKRHWLQIDTKNSAITFPNPGNEQFVNTFAQLPFPFAFEQTTVVVPSFDAVSSDMYEMILTRFRLNDHMTVIVTEDELEDNMRETGHLILLNTNLLSLGAEQSILPENMEDAGFVSGTEHITTTIERNPWNKEKVVLTMEQRDGPLRTTDFIEQLFNSKSKGTIGVYTSAGHLSFNKNDEHAGDAKAAMPISNTVLIAFVGLLIAIVAIIVVIVRRKKKVLPLE